LAAVALLAGVSVTCSADAEHVYAVAEGLYPPHGAAYSMEGPGPYLASASTAVTYVRIAGVANTQYDEIHVMDLKLDGVTVDNDSGGGRRTTDNMGEWRRDAHLTGQLYGERFLGVGVHFARIDCEISAARVPNGAELLDGMYFQNQFTIYEAGTEPPGGGGGGMG
jgi:hypothetical protein